MKHLYFVRHGQSQANVERVHAGRMNTPLTKLGKQQALGAGKQAASLHIDHIISSPLRRAHDTAVIIAEAIGFPADKIELNNLFMERDYGSATGSPWEADLDLDGFTDMEALDALNERAQLAYRHIRTLPYETILVVSHGTFWQKFYVAVRPGKVVTAANEPGNAEVTQLI